MGLLAPWISFCMRWRGFDVGFCFILVSPCAGRRFWVCSRLGSSYRMRERGFDVGFIFYFH
jgi:hypothetical protein